MSTSGMTVTEIQETLTGFDEIAMEKHMGLDPYMDVDRKPIGVTRALVFVHLRHGGTSDADAKKVALEMTFKEVNAYFGEDEALEEDPTDDEPVTDAGKEDAPPTSKQKTKQPSAS